MTRLSLGVRLRLLQLGSVVLFLVLAAQLARVQWLDPTDAPRWGAGIAPRTVTTEPARGVITDRNGTVLARNVAGFRLALIPGLLPADQRERSAMLTMLAATTGAPLDRLINAADSDLARVDPYRPAIVMTDLAADRAIALRAALAGQPALRIEAAPSRWYEPSGALGHLLGYVGAIPEQESAVLAAHGYDREGRIGLSGIEAQYEDALRGGPGSRLILADPQGREVGMLDEHPARTGATVELSIDLALQRATENALRRGIASGLSIVRPVAGRPAPAPGGAAVVLDTRTGEVLSLVSLPSYDANLFGSHTSTSAFDAVLHDPSRPLVDRTYMEVRAPGSIFKPLVALAALEEGIATIDTRITSTGAITVQDEYNPAVRYVFRDWEAHGNIDMTRALARSSDVYFYLLAGGYRENGREQFRGMGADTLAKWARLGGLGRPTGIDLPGEVAGLVPDSAWKQREVGDAWLLGDTYTFGIGQGYLTTTPIQMAVLTAAFANGGDLLVPRVVRATRSDGVTTPTARQTSGRLPGSSAHFEQVRNGMRAAAQLDGTAFTGVPAGMRVAAKTGTAEFGQAYPDGQYDTHGWFIAFGPYEQPEVAVVVYLEYGVGSTHAGPVAKEILESYLATRGGAQRVAAR